MSAKRLLGLIVVAGAAVTIALFGGGENEVEAADDAEPAVVEHVDGSDVSRVVLTKRAAERTGVKTSPVRAAGEGLALPYAALIYDAHGETWVYTNPENLVYVRERVAVERIDGNLAYVSEGPAEGTKVVSVGGAELYGTEFEVGH
jgi:hypothetical protein